MVTRHALGRDIYDSLIYAVALKMEDTRPKRRATAIGERKNVV